MQVFQAPKYAMFNKEDLLASKSIGCYNCLAILGPQDITEFVDNNQTGVCPKCKEDMLLSDKHLIISPETLSVIQRYFGKD